MTVKKKTAKTKKNDRGLKDLINRGKDKGFVTLREVNESLAADVMDASQIDDVIGVINNMGITVYDKTPDENEIQLAIEGQKSSDNSKEESGLIVSEDDSARTTDTVRMYMREMGTVPLLNRQGEIAIAKRIEDGICYILSALAKFPHVIDSILHDYELTKIGEKRLSEIVSGFVDLDAEAVDDNVELEEDEEDEEDELLDIEEEEQEITDEDLAELEDYEAKPEEEDEDEDEEEEEDEDEAEGTEDDSGDDEDLFGSGVDPEEAAKHFGELAKINKKYRYAIKRYGKKHRTTLKRQHEILEC